MRIPVHIQNTYLVEKLLILGRGSLEKEDHYQRNTQDPYCETAYPKNRMKREQSLKDKPRIPRAFSIL